MKYTITINITLVKPLHSLMLLGFCSQIADNIVATFPALVKSLDWRVRMDLDLGEGIRCNTSRDMQNADKEVKEGSA